MEENNVFTPQDIIQEETEQTENIHSESQSEFTYASKPDKEPAKPKKKGTFKKFAAGLLSMILIPSAVGFGSGIAAYKLMDNSDKVVLQTIQSQNITTGTNTIVVGSNNIVNGIGNAIFGYNNVFDKN